MAAHNWRALRSRAMNNGIGNLMTLPSMHQVLDMIESMGAESATHGSKSETEARAALSSYYDKLYKPDRTTMQINGDGYLPPPPGFSDEEVEASFDAFISSGAR